MASYLLCNNILIESVVISGGDVDFPFVNAVNSGTAQQAKFSSQGTAIIIDLGSTKEYNTLAIAKHNVFSATGGNGYVNVSSGPSVSGPFTLNFQLDPTSDRVSLRTDSISHTSQYIRIEVGSSEALTTDIFIGNISLGVKTDISDGQYIGFISPDMANAYELKANVTRGGEIAGIIRQAVPIKTVIRGRHRDKVWFDQYWPEVNEYITKYPFYFEWEEGQQVMYCWAKKITPPTWNRIDKMEFSINAEGFI